MTNGPSFGVVDGEGDALGRLGQVDASRHVGHGLVVAVELQRELRLRAGHAVEPLEEVLRVTVGLGATHAPDAIILSYSMAISPYQRCVTPWSFESIS